MQPWSEAGWAEEEAWLLDDGWPHWSWDESEAYWGTSEWAAAAWQDGDSEDLQDNAGADVGAELNLEEGDGAEDDEALQRRSWQRRTRLWLRLGRPSLGWSWGKGVGKAYWAEPVYNIYFGAADLADDDLYHGATDLAEDNLSFGAADFADDDLYMIQCEADYRNNVQTYGANDYETLCFQGGDAGGLSNEPAEVTLFGTALGEISFFVLDGDSRPQTHQAENTPALIGSRWKLVPEESEAEDSGADLKEALAVIAEQEKKMKSLKAKLKGAVVSKGSAASSRQGSDLDDVRSQAPSDMSTSSYKQVAE
eukprot:s3212_g7.t1